MSASGVKKDEIGDRPSGFGVSGEGSYVNWFERAIGSGRLNETGKALSDAEGQASAEAALVDPKRNSEDILVRELSKLTVQEREKVYQDIHGVSEIINETPEVVQTSLSRLHKELNDFPSGKFQNKKSSFELALKKDPQYVLGKSLGLKFLRAAEFDPRRAAEIMIEYFWNKQLLFGDEKLVKQAIEQSDLDPDDLACLRNGHVQILPSRDRSGRAVVCNALCYQSYRSVGNQVKTFFYIMGKLSEDEETQKRGVVTVLYNVGDMPFKFSAELLLSMTRVVNSAPFRLAGMHACFNNNVFHRLIQTARKNFAPRTSVRIREHYGSHLEVRYELLTYGIPANEIQVDLNGELHHDRHKQWLANQSFLESSKSLPTKGIMLPTRFDVLSGRAHINHPGNLRLNHLIEEHFAEYSAASKPQKTEIAVRIVDHIVEKGGKFLKYSRGVWVEMSPGDAREKVAYTFRSRRRPIKNMLNGPSPSPKLAPMPNPGVPANPSAPPAASLVSGKRDVASMKGSVDSSVHAQTRTPCDDEIAATAPVPAVEPLSVDFLDDFSELQDVLPEIYSDDIDPLEYLDIFNDPAPDEKRRKGDNPA